MPEWDTGAIAVHVRPCKNLTDIDEYIYGQSIMSYNQCKNPSDYLEINNMAFHSIFIAN